MTDTPPPPVAGTDARETTRELSDEVLDAIDARAKAATPGPWSAKTLHMTYSTVWAPSDPGERIADVLEEANAAHIAGLDPQTVRALVAMARRAKP